MIGCPGPYPNLGIVYWVYVYYKNSKGENLLDPSTIGHYNRGDVKINGMGLGVGEFRVDSARYHSPLPKGFALSFPLPNSTNSTGETISLITLNNTTTDTLASRILGTVLKSCTYNRVNVLPANLSTPVFPVVIVK